MDRIFVLPHISIAYLVSSAGFILTTWLAAYLAAHVPRRLPSRLAFLSLFALAVYFLHLVLCWFIPAGGVGYLWRRHMGWFVLWPLPLALHLTSALLPAVQRARQRLPIRLTYFVCGFLSLAWLYGNWSFSRTVLLPPELVWPIALFAAATGALALINTQRLRRQAADRILRIRYSLLGAFAFFLMGGLLFWPAFHWLRLAWPPYLRFATGDGILLAAPLVLAYAIAYHSAFLAGRWVRRDLVFHAVVVATIASVYFLALISSRWLSMAFGFDALLLSIITIVGLAILTHLLTVPMRRWWDGIFFKQLRPLSSEARSLVRSVRASEGRLQHQMAALVRRLQELSGASACCVALREGDAFIVKASTNSEHVGLRVPFNLTAVDLSPADGREASKYRRNGPTEPAGEGLADVQEQSRLWNCLVLAEPILDNGEVAGYLLLGERGMGEGYDREERLWISALAAYLGTALEQARRREETARLMVELRAEARDLAAQERSLQGEFEAALAGPLPRISRQELREAIYASNDPERLARILTREESTLAALACVARDRTQPAQALRRLLANALESMTPIDLPPLEAIRNRAMRNKRLQQLPAPIADYYTLRLVMAGHTHETVAEMMEVSPRQVRNYLDRAIGSVKAFLEQEASRTPETAPPRRPTQLPTAFSHREREIVSSP